jgi:hypothetical protein
MALTEFLPKALWAQMVERLCRFLGRHLEPGKT